MSKKNKNQISIPIVKDNKDLCRLIFQKAEAGNYDIKIECLGNPYQVYTYRLFSMSPICWNIDNPQDVNMSYHHGAHDYPILIHLKDNSKEGRERYHTLPATRILPPNVNQMFPIPLFRLEIPQQVVDGALEYKAKSYHHVLDAGIANVLEIYMAPENFEMDTYFERKYATILLPQIMLSMEYFATNTVISDYAKNSHFLPEDEPVERFMSLGGLPGMKLFVAKYTVPEWDEYWDQLHFTFIENELAEEILLCTKVAYPKVNLRPDVYDRIYMGGATLEQLKPPTGPWNRIPVMTNTTVMKALKSHDLSQEEKDALTVRAGAARGRLYRELVAFSKKLEEEKHFYTERAREFLHRLRALDLPKENKLSSEAVYILFARFLGLTHYVLYRRIISNDKVTYHHVWLELDDMLEIDILRGQFNLLLNKSTEPDILISRSKPHFSDDNWEGMKSRLEQKGYQCENIQHATYDTERLKAIYEQENGYLEEVYGQL